MHRRQRPGAKSIGKVNAWGSCVHSPNALALDEHGRFLVADLDEDCLWAWMCHSCLACLPPKEQVQRIRKFGKISNFHLRVEFLLKTDSGYPKDTGVNKPWQPLGIPSAITPIGQFYQSPPSPIPGDLGRGPSHQSTCSNIETRMDRTKSVVRVIRGIA